MTGDPPAAGATIRITGLPSAAKPTVALLLRDTLTHARRRAYVLEEAFCASVNRDPGFSLRDRPESVRRTGEIVRMMADSARIAIGALISPLIQGRAAVRQRHAAAGVAFLELCAGVALSVCEARYFERLYRRARAGGIAEFIGIGSPSDDPTSPDIHFDDGMPLAVVEPIVARLALSKETR